MSIGIVPPSRIEVNSASVTSSILVVASIINEKRSGRERFSLTRRPTRVLQLATGGR